MKINRSISENSTANTSLFNVLNYIDENCELLHYLEHKLRHPLAIYNKGSSHFLSDYERLIEFLIKYRSNSEEFYNRSADLYGFIRAVISSFSSFIDDIYSIFKCFYSINESSYKGKYNNRWVQKADPFLYENYEKYKKQITTISVFININNELKHANGSISTLAISTKYYGTSYGFFIEGLDDKGCIIPNDKFHNQYNNMRTAYSFNWFLYEILADFYFICECASKSLSQLLINRSFSLSGPRIDNVSNNKDISKLIGSLESACSRLLFFDEYEYRPITQISLINNVLTIQKPASKSFINRFLYINSVPCRISMRTSGDGVSRNFGLVYYQD